MTMTIYSLGKGLEKPSEPGDAVDRETKKKDKLLTSSLLGYSIVPTLLL